MIKTPLSTVIGGAFWTPGATILGSSSKNLTQLIKSIFATGEQGFAYDPDDLSTLYQDAAGTIPVTEAGQTVGLVLDKSKGLFRGAEIIINSDFSNGKTGWVDVNNWWSVVNGRAYHPVSSVYNEIRQSIASAAGKFVEVTFNIEVLQGTAIVGLSSANIGGQVFGVGTHNAKFYALASATSSFFAARTSGLSTEFYIDNVSVKEIAGNHAYNTTSAQRPLLVANPQRLDYDTVDDKLTTTLPTQLTGCTVVRSVPNVGTQILTGQIIPTIYNDNIDNCGLIVINRALTASETSQITKLFNKAAGGTL